MTSFASTLEKLDPDYREKLVSVYGEASLPYVEKRIAEAVAKFKELFGSTDGVIVCSAPGRTEIGGNHTDHNAGRVLAAAINLDAIAVARKSADHSTRVYSEGMEPFFVDMSSLDAVESESGTSAALVRGAAKGLSDFGYEVGAFEAYVTSDVLVGSGLSSSAAFEVLMGAVYSHLFSDGKATPVELAIAGKLAENEFYGKPSGMMDQTASANGGFVSIDFADSAKPVIRAIQFDIEKAGYALCVVAAGDDHENLTDQYAAIPAEMKSVAKLLGHDLLRRSSKEEVLQNIAEIRRVCGDRAVLRAMHFFSDDERAYNEAKLLDEGDFDGFLDLINESGLSSIRYLQNVSDINEPSRQGLALALMLSADYLNGRGASRVHGGGFAGTILAFVPLDMLDGYRALMESAFGEGCCLALSVRSKGAVRVL